MTNIKRPDGNLAVINAAQQVVRTAEAIDSAIDRTGAPGSGIVVPKTMTIRNAVRRLEEYAEAESSKTKISHTIKGMHGLPAALAFRNLLTQHYGVDFAKPKPGFFGPTYPVDITIPVSPTHIERITLGEFTLGNLTVETKIHADDGGVPRLTLIITCANAHKHDADALIALTADMPDAWSGQCLVFEGNDPVREPKIVAPSFKIEDIALNPQEASALQMFVNQIRRHETLATKHGIPFKRGVLLYGPYGTGKTLAAAVSMQEAISQGITVIQERSWANLHNTMRLARDMQPCLVFCEDIDRIDNRALTNLLDDANLKHCAVSLVVTTNHPERLDPALTRTGRLDIAIGFDLPNKDTRARILAINNAPFYNDDIAEATNGFTGSDLAECAKRAVINAEASFREMTAVDVLGAAVSMKRPPKYIQPDQLGDHLAAIGHAMNGSAFEGIEKMLSSIINHFDIS